MIAVPAMDPGFVVVLTAFALLGVALGGAHFASLAWNVQVLLREPRWMLAFAPPLLRVAVSGSGLAFAAFHGAAALLACVTGFLALRAVALRIARAPS